MKEENGLDSAPNVSIKRKAEDEQESPPKRQKRKKQKTTRPKNALMRLNELKPGLQYIIESREGPPHNPTFVVSVEVCGQKFTGRGQSKQLAKCAAAQCALDDVCGSDLTGDNIENETGAFNQSEGGKKIKMDLSKEEAEKRLEKIKTEAEDKNPVMVLNELHPGIEFILVKENVALPAQRFTMSVEINGTTFEGSGPNKKLAKAAVSRVALSSLYNINYNVTSTTSQGILPEEFIFPQSIADKISDVIHKTFQEVMVDNVEYAKWKVLAGIAMTSDPEMNKIKIIGISTGTKCINGEHISMNGVCLNDCHAEIISRRCLKNFLYYNLEMISAGLKEDSIFMPNENGAGYCLKPNIKFHLYISTSPCGDARIFSPHEEATSKNPVDHHPNRKTRGLLRTKIESGEGTIPVKSGDAIQTWDGIIQGQQRLLTMSCSDKVAAWNIVGIQGALLSYFIEPIYLESIILGSLFHPGHMLRAMWGRFENSLGELSKPFSLNKPKMCCITNPETRQLSKSPNFSVNWIVGFGKPEVINATTGKLENGEFSRLSKRSFFERYSVLFSKISSVTKKKTKKPPQLYSEAKNSAPHYQAAKTELRKAFMKAGLGTWVQKPEEQDDFDLS
ncbi:double-stranded RNA-specific editase 1-like [Centruroides sculpturatus]|uniref:double-stranded RNA-specific editase 1-like n=1 Tax=Centruroides sculpturatus TaxID=218467 RepID=UPI000C6D581A|nr:double-stranded RNA-specific editase 1-like [Centruroides sculpturatus]XP_023227835.1 double-stranded RNA-specific editase 1-like [Centruroides sculpturatus]XP_023227836.1 double-stranded RNA-specific editase 1-like [Centruroides sculpturatus]